MDINSNGEIFLAGHTLSGTQNWDTYTMKLNNDGELLWEQKLVILEVLIHNIFMMKHRELKPPMMVDV